MTHIPFNRPFFSGQELSCIEKTHELGQMSGDGHFTMACQEWLQSVTGCARALLTHSCTGALEMMALLADLEPGDEVIMPSYTFVSGANAFVLRGAVPVFVDIRSDTLNIDEQRIEAAITPRTRAIVPMHYAGVGCAMDEIVRVAERHGLQVFEDAAQGILASYRDRALGTWGRLGSFSFHETKNVIAGEGGALLVNDPGLVERAEIIREKGTNRSRFFRGQVDKYTWVDIGSSYLPGEIIAAFLWAQLQAADSITQRRVAMWQRYHEAFEPLEAAGRLRRPVVPGEATCNGHLYHLMLRDLKDRAAFIEHMRQADIQCVFHYIPLHTAPHGARAGRTHGPMTTTEQVADRLVRLPLWIGLEEHQQRVIEQALRYLEQTTPGVGIPRPSAPAPDRFRR